MRGLRLAPALGLLGLLGCISDFSPDPLKGPQNLAQTPDGGRALADGSTTLGAPTITAPLPSADAGLAAGPVLNADAGSIAPASGGAPCDLSGRWIATERAQSSAYGAQQVSLNWLYLELDQQGDTFTITRSLLCGGSTNNAPGELFEVHMDDHLAWPGYQAYSNYNGRRGSATLAGAGCQVQFEQAVLVRGMTVDYYKDASHPLPTLDQRENGATPGWADWDNDGNPGVSMVVTGVASGTIYTSLRVTTTSLSGAFAQGASSIRLDDYNWKQERVVLGSKDPDPFNVLASPAERNPGAGLNFVELARLGADQATGGDDDVCAAIRALVPTLNPAANAN